MLALLLSIPLGRNLSGTLLASLRIAKPGPVTALVATPPGVAGSRQLQALIGSMVADSPHLTLDEPDTPPADITLSYDTLVQPDLLVADTAAFIQSGKWTDVTTLFLVIEVISPSSTRTDRETKRPEYQQHGVPQYWIVDGDQRQVEVWTPGADAPVIERERLRWRHPALDAECVIDLTRLFDFG